MTVSYLEILDAGLCQPMCLLALPTSSCDCRCEGRCHGDLTSYLNRQAAWSSNEFPGYEGVWIEGELRRRLSSSPDEMGEWIRGMVAAMGDVG